MADPLRRREYFWFVESYDPHTNECFCEHLGAENSFDGKRVKNGGLPKVWRCTLTDVIRFHKSRRQAQLDFVIYKASGRDAEMEVVNEGLLCKIMSDAKRGNQKRAAVKGATVAL